MRQGDTLCWVYATDNDTRKEEFFPPEHSPLYTGRSNEAYIEAVDDERFGICFGIPSRTIREYGADTVCVELNIDRGATSLALVMKLRDQDMICEKIDSFTCLKEGSWQECGFAFRKMNLDEDLILSHDEAKHESKTFGSIKVTVMRGHSQQRTDPNAGIIPASNRQLDQHSSSKRLIKDNGVTHSVNTPVLRSLNSRRGIPLKFMRLPNDNCHIASFVFKYRSQMSLELKRIIGDDREVIPVPQHGIQQEVKQEMKGSETPRIKTTALPMPLKRGSFAEHDLEIEHVSADSPTKRRKSVPDPFTYPMKVEGNGIGVAGSSTGAGTTSHLANAYESWKGAALRAKS